MQTVSRQPDSVEPLELRNPQADAVPPLSDEDDALLFEIYLEFATREEKNESVDPEHFCQKHPHLRKHILQLIDQHRYLLQNPELIAADTHETVIPEVGDTFRGFYLEEVLGGGNNSRVYRAADTKRGGRPVVVKVSSQGNAEALILGPLDHQNVMRVDSVDYDESRDLTVVCMPYMGRSTLGHVLQHIYQNKKSTQNAQAIHDAVQMCSGTPARIKKSVWRRWVSYEEGIRLLAAQICDGLAYVHAHGICHRDLKPSNVLIADDGKPMLIDFHMATSAQWNERIPGGTLPYFSPEHVQNALPELFPNPPEIDAKSDIFSIGVVLYELLSGKHPFEFTPVSHRTEGCRPVTEFDDAEENSNDGQVQPKTAGQRKADAVNSRYFQLAQRQQLGWRPLHEVCPTADKKLCRLVQRCLAWRPEDRPQSAAEVARELRRLPVRRRAICWTLQHPLWAAMILVFSILATAGVAAFAARQGPGAPVADFDLGVQAFAAREYKTAIKHFAKTIDTDPKRRIEALLGRGRAWQQLAFMEKDKAKRKDCLLKALTDLTAADNAAPQPVGRIKACLGHIYDYQRELILARLYYEKSIELGFSSVAVRNNLGRIHARKINEEKQAIEHLSTALKWQPDCQAALHNRALVYLKMHLHIQRGADITPENDVLDKAITDICEAVAVGPGSGELYLDGARVFAIAAKFEPARKEKALSFARKAIAHGIPHRRIFKDFNFRSFVAEDRWQDLTNVDVGPDNQLRAVRILDPLQGEAN